MIAMYEACWGLREAPFDGAPNPKFLYPSPGHEEALARLVRAVAGRQGAALLSGETGSPLASMAPSGSGRPCGTSACVASGTRCA